MLHKNNMGEGSILGSMARDGLCAELSLSSSLTEEKEKARVRPCGRAWQG